MAASQGSRPPTKYQRVRLRVCAAPTPGASSCSSAPNQGGRSRCTTTVAGLDRCSWRGAKDLPRRRRPSCALPPSSPVPSPLLVDVGRKAALQNIKEGRRRWRRRLAVAAAPPRRPLHLPAHPSMSCATSSAPTAREEDQLGKAVRAFFSLSRWVIHLCIRPCIVDCPYKKFHRSCRPTSHSANRKTS